MQPSSAATVPSPLPTGASCAYAGTFDHLDRTFDGPIAALRAFCGLPAVGADLRRLKSTASSAERRADLGDRLLVVLEVDGAACRPCGRLRS